MLPAPSPVPETWMFLSSNKWSVEVLMSEITAGSRSMRIARGVDCGCPIWGNGVFQTELIPELLAYLVTTLTYLD
ncbi:hypothetical protein WICPIJ_005350 [Wickerhamomyces pijperi]|uniref:Uncharacterized protein n=1 Tax=Wickerhamomyces pijperi TaxID=599730 RepID=A0A9P8Q417_WICPI|nr:hypothetical protein WICPIJ_005350 [Wickerhamomyces pijperi]